MAGRLACSEYWHHLLGAHVISVTDLPCEGTAVAAVSIALSTHLCFLQITVSSSHPVSIGMPTCGSRGGCEPGEGKLYIVSELF